ncbi:MAG TPA: aldehyde dehydrogenase (NADP(+)) [Microlunatus sp.]|nr:aldehyde dehydrogenase (NADP(+)) [Microlunatus sp.]
MVQPLTGASLIGGTDVRPPGSTFRAADPTTGTEIEPSFGEAGAAEVDLAAALAAEAFRTYRGTTAEQRAAFLESIATGIEQIAPALADRVTTETGLPATRIAGETARTVGQLRLFADLVRDQGWRAVRVDTPLPDRSPLPRPDLRQRAVPVGPVAVFGASNFPLAFSVAGGDTASALAAACPVIVKGHPAHPGTSELVGRVTQGAVAEHGLPAGTFALLQGTSHELGSGLVTDPRIKAVGFTGSRGGGLALVAAAQRRPEPIPVYAEMSSVNPVFLLPGALADGVETTATAYAASVTGSAGQLCTQPGLVFALDGPDTDAFVEAVGARISQVAATPMLTSGIAGAFDRGAAAVAGTAGVTTAATGRPADDLATPGLPALFVTDGDTFLATPELAAEVFGPSSLVVKVRDTDQLQQIVGNLEGQLTASVHLSAADHELAAELLGELELVAGRVLVNGWPTGVEVGHAMVHGGPFPATSAPSTTSVGTRAIERFLRPVVYQDVPEELLPPELRADADVPRLVDGVRDQGRR